MRVIIRTIVPAELRARLREHEDGWGVPSHRIPALMRAVGEPGDLLAWQATYSMWRLAASRGQRVRHRVRSTLRARARRSEVPALR